MNVNTLPLSPSSESRSGLLDAFVALVEAGDFSHAESMIPDFLDQFQHLGVREEIEELFMAALWLERALQKQATPAEARSHVNIDFPFPFPMRERYRSILECSQHCDISQPLASQASPDAMRMECSIFQSYILAIFNETNLPILPFSPETRGHLETAVRHWCKEIWISSKPPLVSGGHIIAIMGILFSRGLDTIVPFKDLHAEIQCEQKQFRNAIHEMKQLYLFRGLPWKFESNQVGCKLIARDIQGASIPAAS